MYAMPSITAVQPQFLTSVLTLQGCTATSALRRQRAADLEWIPSRPSYIGTILEKDWVGTRHTEYGTAELTSIVVFAVLPQTNFRTRCTTFHSGSAATCSRMKEGEGLARELPGVSTPWTQIAGTLGGSS